MSCCLIQVSLTPALPPWCAVRRALHVPTYSRKLLKSIWISGLFNSMSFLTSNMQVGRRGGSVRNACDFVRSLGIGYFKLENHMIHHPFDSCSQGKNVWSDSISKDRTKVEGDQGSDHYCMIWLNIFGDFFSWTKTDLKMQQAFMQVCLKHLANPKLHIPLKQFTSYKRLRKSCWVMIRQPYGKKAVLFSEKQWELLQWCSCDRWQHETTVCPWTTWPTGQPVEDHDFVGVKKQV